jgi:hypothetical protein
MTRLSETVHEWMGWCPNAYAPVRNKDLQFNSEALVPSAGGSIKDRTFHWIGLFRNQILLFAILTSATGFMMFADLCGGSYPLLFICGIIAGLLFSAYAAIWYERIFNEVLHEGPVVLWNRYDASTATLTVTGTLAPFIILPLVLIGAIPGVNLTMTNAITAGFIFIIFWGLVVSTWKWESENHRSLQYDGMILELEKEETNAIR